jgi:hypothetical protein
MSALLPPKIEIPTEEDFLAGAFLVVVFLIAITISF